MQTRKKFNLDISLKIVQILFFGIGLPLFGSWISTHYVQDWRLNHEPLHSVVEVFGSFIAFVTLYLIYLLKTGLTSKRADTIWTVNALLTMGILDLFHSIVHVGEAVIWFHSTATFFGGFFFALVWLPDVVSAKLTKSPKYVGAFVTLLGLLSIVFPDSVPEMFIDGKFTMTAKLLDFCGSCGYIVAFTYFFRNFIQSHTLDDYLLSSHCLLFGVAGLLFEMSVLWDAEWWWWHVLRLVAYLVLGAFFYNFAKTSIETQTLAAIIESSEDAILSEDLYGNILSWNYGAKRVYGYSADEALRMNVLDLAPDELKHEVEELLARVANGECLPRRETIRVRKDGKHIDVSLVVSPIKDHNGEIIAASSIARDISERKEKDKLLAEKTMELERSNQDLEQFAHIISHDLQEPLRVVNSYVELLINYFQKQGIEFDEKRQTHAMYITDSVKRMRNMIRDVLNLSRIGRTTELQTVNLVEVFNVVKMNLEQKIKDTGAQITLNGDLPLVSGRTTELTQLFQNLIGNAMKFTVDGIKPEIQIWIEQISLGKWQFTIQDNGIGIDAKYYESVFMVFQRLDREGTYEGTGMGLALCKKIVENHGGEIWLESELGKGTSFFFTLINVNDQNITQKLQNTTTKRNSSSP